MKSSQSKSVSRKKAGPVKAPIPFRDRVDLYSGGKMKRVPKQKEGSSVLQTYLNVVPEQKSLVETMNNTSGEKKGGNDSAWLSNLNVYIDPTSATSFLHQPGAKSTSESSSSSSSSTKKSCSSTKSSSCKATGGETEVKWTSRDDPGMWREFLIVLLMLSITIAVCFGAMGWVLKHNPPPPPAVPASG